MRSAECGIESEPLTPKMGLEETLALTPALSPRRGGSTHSSQNFHALWCGIASWGLTSAATKFMGIYFISIFFQYALPVVCSDTSERSYKRSTSFFSA